MFKNCQEGSRNSDRYRYASFQSYIYQLEEEVLSDLRGMILLCVHGRGEGLSDCLFGCFVLFQKLSCFAESM